MDLTSEHMQGEPRQPSAGPIDRLVETWLSRAMARVEDVRLMVRLPSGYRFVCGHPDATRDIEWSLKRWNAVMRIASSGALGFAEGYINDEWDTPDLQALLTTLSAELDKIQTAQRRGGPSRLLARLKHLRNANTRKGSRRNISFHYDLGNTFYGHWLDETMTYSSAVFDQLDEPLADAQRRKYRRICDQLELREGQSVLEIGCGWGGFAEVAAGEYGARVTGVTLSKEQLDFAQQRMLRLGLADKVDLRLQDYRDIPETFDAVASIEMFEAVGEEHWPIYFKKLHACLKPGGKAALQIITIREQDFEGYRTAVDFIQKYIFPGGMLPPPVKLDQLASEAGLKSDDVHMFASSYAETLRRWHEDFDADWDRIAPLGFDQRFRRIWKYYLAYCEAGFDTGRIDVGQFVYRRP